MSWHLNPSSAGRWVNCPGSVRLSYLHRIPATDRSQAEEGIAAHTVAMEMLEGRAITNADEDMIAGAELYRDVVLERGSGQGKLLIESYINAPSIHEKLGGTPDCWSFSNDVIDIYDYKYGHRYVDVYENWQMLSYAAACLDNTNSHESTQVNMVIVQPRSYCVEGAVRVWSVMAYNLKPYFAKLKAAADETQKPDSVCNTGTWCLNCPVSHVCEALQQSSYIACDLSSSATMTLDDDSIGAEFALLSEASSRLTSRIGGIEEDIIYRINTGHNILGYTMSRTAGREVWDKPIEAIIDVGNMLDIDLSKPGIMTPNQARKAGVPESILETFSKRVAGSLKLKKTKAFLSKIFDKNVKL